MDEKDPTIRERLAIVENELKHFNREIKNLREECTTKFTSLSETLSDSGETLTGLSQSVSENTKKLATVDKQLTSYNETLHSLTVSVDKKLRGSLSGGEKASIIIALITSIGAILVSLIK